VVTSESGAFGLLHSIKWLKFMRVLGRLVGPFM